MKRKLILTAVAIALTGMASTANAYTGSNSNAVGLNTAQQKSAVSVASPNVGWYSSFSWYLKNNSNYTLTNIYVAHSASDAVNDHSIATLAPHASAGPFYGDWYSGSPDFWKLSFWTGGYPFWSASADGPNTRKKCSVEPGDLGKQPIIVDVFSGDHLFMDGSVMYFTPFTGSLQNDNGFGIEMPPGGSSSCSDLLADQQAE